MLDIGFCTRCGALLDEATPPTEQHCWRCVGEESEEANQSADPTAQVTNTPTADLPHR